jgi:hypothetical protein
MIFIRVKIYSRDKGGDSMLVIHFFPIGSRINPAVLRPGTYKRGTANLTPNADKLVNRLTVKGGMALSDPYTQAITIGADPIPLNYVPRDPASGGSITITIGGTAKSLGIQNIDQPGSYDFLLNATEKLLVPDLCTSGSGTIVYSYEYPIRFVIEDASSIKAHGIFDDILTVDATDETTALELGIQHLYQFSEPIYSGTIDPFRGNYMPGELIMVDIPGLKISQYMNISEVSYDSQPGGMPTNITLKLDSIEQDISHILKDLNKRLAAIEKMQQKDSQSPLEKYVSVNEPMPWQEVVDVPGPIPVQEWTWWREQVAAVVPIMFQEPELWSESVSMTALALPLPADNLYPGDTLYPG